MDFNERGWGIGPKRSHDKGGRKSAGKGAVDLARGSIVVYLSSHTYVHVSGNLRTLRCSCKSAKVAQRNHKCRGRGCLGSRTLSCGCQGHCFLRPPPSRPTGAIPTGDASGGYSGARGRSYSGRGGSTANHGRSGSIANRRKGESNEVRSASGAAVHTSHGGDPCWYGGGRGVGWYNGRKGPGSRSDPSQPLRRRTRRVYRPRVEEFSRGLDWSGRERENSTSEAGNVHGDDFTFYSAC